MKKIIIATVLATVFAASTSVAQTATSEKQANNAVKFRQSIFQLVRSNMGPLGAMAKGRIEYDADTMALNGQRIEHLSMMLEDYFALDTKGFDVKTGAKDSIWKNQADFNNKALDMLKAAQNLQVVANAKDEANYRKAIGAVGASCKACHDDYKKD